MRFIDQQDRVCMFDIGSSEEDFKELGVNHNGFALVLNRLPDDPDNMLSCLGAATELLYLAANTVRNRKDLDPRVQDFLSLLGPAMQSFTNSKTMREGGKKFYEFDYNLSRTLPTLET